MNAPDKIYIDDLAVVNDCITKNSIKPLPFFSEYIRKDSLLEWAKVMKKICKGAKPIEKTYQTVIDKIESL